ncbi:hypothetical protein NKR23_g9634 [Pleurostoma richardsiae]|uniref:DUF4211 domain-containing protein n=1 Tax=Pleurostoma richardsiae TaxID=41990 RepID=A0AA38RPT4_9PEZI|nr:hypothetical protein NKR23_g9634 [Pleurostoma richardsiae]
MAKRKRQKQSTLTFEPVGASSPGGSFSPANVRYSTASKSSPIKARNGKGPSASQETQEQLKTKLKQQTLDSHSGASKDFKAGVSEPKKTQKPEDGTNPVSIGSNVHPRSSQPQQSRLAFMRSTRISKRHVMFEDSSESEDELSAVQGNDRDGSAQNSRHKTSQGDAASDVIPSIKNVTDNATRKQAPTSSQSLPVLSDDDDEDVDSDAPLVTPRPRHRHRKNVIVIDDEDDEDEDKDASEDDDVQTPAKRRRLTHRARVGSESANSSESEDLPPVQSSRLLKKSTVGPKSGMLSPKTSQPMSTPRRPSTLRSQKKKHMEILRRRRAGEIVEDLSESSEEDRPALYDTDSDHLALSEFEDDEEEGEKEELAPPKKRKNIDPRTLVKDRASGSSKMDTGSGDNNENDLDDFIVEDDEDDALGVPAAVLRNEIPLEFTAHAHKPLKDHFRDAIEWLVHRRINPGFNKDDEVYQLAWRKLYHEVLTLAESKFMSTVWKSDFRYALQARPYIEQQEIVSGGLALENCQACGRGSHPATWRIRFSGAPYSKDTLDEVDSSNDEDSDDSARDEDGMRIPPESREWFVGVTCNSNAETAHDLIHWKKALDDWVMGQLESGGWMEPEKCAERDRMRAKERRKLADQIIDEWEANRVVKGLFGDFMANLETARNKPTTARRRGMFRR